MKKHILALYILLTNLSFIGAIKADHMPFCSDTKNKTKTLAATSQKSQSVPYTLTKNNISGIFANDSLRNTNGDLLFSNDKISISSVYPNPASAYASIDYMLAGSTTSAKIILCNVLGNVVGEYTLIRDARRLNISTLELTSGVYFYALYVDGKNLVTRKLIIKHHS